MRVIFPRNGEEVGLVGAGAGGRSGSDISLANVT